MFVSHRIGAKVKNRKWFSFLVRFRGLTATVSEEEIASVPLHVVNDARRVALYGGLDASWTTELKLVTTANDLKGNPRISMETLLGEEEQAGPHA